MIGQTISHYRIEKKLGAGGMGEVYLAQDLQLGRSVALKILPPEFVSDEQRLRRFVREAKAACKINHPGAAHIYEINEENGIHFIAMEYVEGETLAARMKRIPMASREIVDVAKQIADTLQEAHSRGIIHRDLKPANIMITNSGRVKLVDFGLAKVQQENSDLSSRLSTASQTEVGIVMGTLPYMSPEQLLGRQIDHRSDIFSFGVVLYELATARLPFQGNTSAELMDAILHKDPPSANDVNRDVSPELVSTITKMLAKEPSERYGQAAEILTDLHKIEKEKLNAAGFMSLVRRPLIAIPLLLFLVLLIAAAVLFQQRSSKIRWAREDALPQIAHLVDLGNRDDAFHLAIQAEKYIPDDPLLKKLWVTMSFSLSVKTDPSGSEVWIRDYSSSDQSWKLIGKTPIQKLRLPRNHFRMKIVRNGFPEILSVIPRTYWEEEVDLSYSSNDYIQIPEGMTRIAGRKADANGGGDHILKPVQEDFWLDQYEVSNREFQKFVDAGGYTERKFWNVPFLKEGNEISFDEAMKNFRDATGRPGPMDWEVGHFRRGTEDDPVTGISWYEAAAYAVYAGKKLPSVDHWFHAAGGDLNSQIVPFSNYDSDQVRLATDEQSMSPFGTYNMAGNVKEWCWNEAADGKRYVLGGSYLEPSYLFISLDSRNPMEREKIFGFRCAMYPSKESYQAGHFDPYLVVQRDYSKEKPVGDEAYAVLKTFYDYDHKKPLNSKTESTQAQGYLTVEKVSFDTAYGSERMMAYLFLPAKFQPPYQTVFYFPHSGALIYDSSKMIEQSEYGNYLDFYVRSGRAVVYPILKGTYERGGSTEWAAEAMSSVQSDRVREWRIQYMKDMRRTIDYLETRKDIDHDRIAYYGYSMGGRVGSIAGALENRFKLLILEHGGFPPFSKPPEVDEINFAPHVHVPVLMINGSFDHVFFVETSQKPMFHMLGTPENQKQHFLFNGGHTSPRNEVVRLILDWLDRYLGPVSS